MVSRAVEAHDLLEEPAVLGASHQLVHQPGVAERQGNPRLVDNLRQLAGPQHGHGVDHDSAGLGGRQPAGNHGRIVGGPNQHPVTGPHAADQVMRDALNDLFNGGARDPLEVIKWKECALFERPAQ